jgi:hypothetical protein
VVQLGIQKQGEDFMAGNKGKPSGKIAEKKTDPGIRNNYNSFGWPEDAPTQYVESGENQQQGNRAREERNIPGAGRGRNRKAGSPV